MSIKKHIRNVPDYPKKGIMFRDITPLLQEPHALRDVVLEIADEWNRKIDVIVGLDARGFIFGGALAFEMVLPFVPVRKKGKLPHETIEVEYALEYGTAVAEMHVDALKKGDRVLIVDDLLATGGTASAARDLVEKLGARVVGFAFVIELASLGGKARLGGDIPVQSLAVYESEDT